MVRCRTMLGRPRTSALYGVVQPVDERLWRAGGSRPGARRACRRSGRGVPGKFADRPQIRLRVAVGRCFSDRACHRV